MEKQGYEPNIDQSQGDEGLKVLGVGLGPTMCRVRFICLLCWYLVSVIRHECHSPSPQLCL